jgi:hypothetical protein
LCRERAHPGAQLTFEDLDGYRYQTFATDSTHPDLAQLDCRHRAHARVEDRIRCAKQARGRHHRRRPARLDPDASSTARWPKPNPKHCATAGLHVAARITHGQRRSYLGVDTNWPWARELATAFARPRHAPLPRHLTAVAPRRPATQGPRTPPGHRPELPPRPHPARTEHRKIRCNMLPHSNLLNELV